MYEHYYNLTGKPFQLNPDPAFFYGSRGHKRAMAYLEYGVHQGEGFIVVTGEVGAGKTTLVRNLFEHLDRDELLAVQLVSTQLNADDILRAVAAAFGLPHEGSKASLLRDLEAHLMACQGEGKRALLVVDEAQNLEPAAVEELRMLSNFQTRSGSLLQSFLLGQPEFRDTLQSPSMRQLRQRVTATYHLGPMDLEETRAYIEHRLGRVNWQGNPAFSAEAFEVLYKATGGIPRRINTLCDRLMLMGYLEELNAFDQDAVGVVVQEMEQDFLAPRVPMEEECHNGAEVLNGEGSLDLGVSAQLERLDSRVSRLERYAVYTSKLSRQILTTVNRGDSA
ncbi:XrtA/PEP-CTERM system-associated ATPase [Aquisalimonas sp.]|uniref:XrtA/PEP-CTERM system-associated ATPase n=1 Tax=Aquisalimonas sp. TaxID=1872621 RepID=UPI0025BA49C3|nr:XrtA/PEP-CTERM system-associated ATPase [Aquisalimonas sp.]